MSKFEKFNELWQLGVAKNISSTNATNETIKRIKLRLFYKKICKELYNSSNKTTGTN